MGEKGKNDGANKMLATHGVDFSNPKPLPKGGKPARTSGTANAVTVSDRCHPLDWAAFTITGRALTPSPSPVEGEEGKKAERSK